MDGGLSRPRREQDCERGGGAPDGGVSAHLFDQSADRNGLEHAQHYVALPGRSEHHTGYALDLSLYFSDGTSADFDGTGSYAWLARTRQTMALSSATPRTRSPSLASPMSPGTTAMWGGPTRG